MAPRSQNREVQGFVGSENLPSAARTRGHLLRILGVGFGVAVAIGDTVGAGILRTPGEVAAQLGSSLLVLAVWALGGAYALFCTASVAELGAMLPQAGGWYVYARRAFGDYGGFLVGCADWLVQCVATAYLGVAFGEFSAGIEPSLRGNIKLVAITALGFLALINWLGIRTGSRAQELTSLVKAFAMIGFVAACLTLGAKVPHTEHFVFSRMAGQPPVWTALVVALQAVIVTYDGWYAPIYFVEEDLNPGTHLPRSAIGGIASCIVIFLLVNVALLHILSMPQLARSQAPAADAAMIVFGSHGKQIILVISLITVISAANATLLIAPRILFAMSRDGLFPRGTALVNKGGTPTVALLLTALAGAALVFNGSFERLIAIASCLYVTVYGSGFAALFVLRKRLPKLARPFRVWGYPWITASVLVGSFLFLIASILGDPANSLLTLLLIAFSYPLYLLAVKKRSREG
jgi:basic amino acid/polyamine antiporter, APA family